MSKELKPFEFDDAIAVIDQAVAAINTNRETHKVIENAITSLKLINASQRARILELEKKLEESKKSE